MRLAILQLKGASQVPREALYDNKPETRPANATGGKRPNTAFQ